MTEPATETPTGLLMEYILAVLAPLLIVGSISDLRLARLAAKEAIDAYKARSDEELITIAQIAGFAIAALDDLRLSAAPELSVSLKLKLRGNAAALNRAGQGNTAALRLLRREEPPPDPRDDDRVREEAMEALEEAEASVREAQTAAPPAPPPVDKRWSTAWAGAMTEVAAECARNLHRLPPRERRKEMVRINLLSGAARRISQTGDQTVSAQTSSASTAKLASQCSPM
nr:hypothetical protein [uncultured Rhodopila sp.]